MGLARFAKEFGGSFIESFGEGFFLSKIDKFFINLALPMIIMNYGGLATLVVAHLSMRSAQNTMGTKGTPE